MQGTSKENQNAFYPITRIWKPVTFQGANKKKHYFEGWYFKNVSANQKHIWSIIPGISIEDQQNRHAFIQFINGSTAETYYVPFAIEDFDYSTTEFRVNIGDNHFSSDGFSLAINHKETNFTAIGKVEFSNTHPLDSTLFNPGIMGWYSFVPFMECNHGLVSMDHNLSGSLTINADKINMDGGKGYAEKDWGSSMPSAWIWMQCNHFENQNQTSFMLSVARIPWLGNSFTGFLCVFLYEGKIYRYASYTGARLNKIEITEKGIHIEINDKQHHISVEAQHASHGLLAAPLKGAMNRRIAESVDATIVLDISNHQKQSFFSGTGHTAGLELVGDINELPI